MKIKWMHLQLEKVLVLAAVPGDPASSVSNLHHLLPVPKLKVLFKYTSPMSSTWNSLSNYIVNCCVIELLTTLINSTLGASTSTSPPTHLVLPPTHSVLQSLHPQILSPTTFWTTNSFEQLKFLNHEPSKDAVKWLSPLTRGLLRITTQETLLSTGKAISLLLLVVRGLEIVVEINCSKLLEWLVQNKLNGGLRQQIYPNCQGSHLNGEQLQRGWHTSHQPYLQGQMTHLEIPLTKVCLQCIHCNLNNKHVGGVGDLTVHVIYVHILH